MATGGVYSEPAAEAWRKRIGEFDAFVALVAEYNHGPTAVLKNAFDSALNEWQRKPIAFVGYGGGGGGPGVRHPRRAGIPQQKAPTPHHLQPAGGALPPTPPPRDA